MQRIITKYFFYLLVFTPILGFILRGIYEFQFAAITLMGNIAILLTFLLIFKYGYNNLKKPKYLTIGLLYAVYYFIWALFTEKVDLFGITKLVFANQALLMLFVFIVIENTHFSDSFIKKLVFLFKITIIISFIFSIIQVLVDPHFFTPQNLQDDTDYFAKLGEFEVRNQSMFGFLDQNDLGLSFIPILALFVGYHFNKKQRSNLQFFVFILMGGLVCFLTNGRYVMVNFIVIFSQILFLKNFSPGKKFSYIILSFLMIGFVIVGLTYLGYDLDKFYDERITSESGNSRIIAFEVFGQLFPEHPILGTGMRKTDELESILYGRSSQIHVGYLSALFEWGVVGAFLIFMFWYKIIKDLYLKAKKTLFYGSFIGFVTFLIANTVLVQYTILFYGLIFCFVFSKYYYNKAGYENENHFISI